MSDKTLDLLQQIAVDIAVIKNRMDHFENTQERVESHAEDLSNVKSQLSLIKWVGGVFGVSVVGMIVRTFTGA